MMASAEPGESWADCFVDELTIRTQSPLRAAGPAAEQPTALSQ